MDKKVTIVNEVIKRLEKFESLIREEGRNGKQTIKVEQLECYTNEFSKLEEELSHAIGDISIKKYGKNNFEEMTKGRREEICDFLISQYMRNFSVKANLQNSVEILEKIPKVVEEVEEEFTETVNRAKEYFSPNLDGNFYFGNNVTEEWAPHSIDEILNRKERFDWVQHEILKGRPQPLYQDRFNLILKEGIKKFIEAKIK